MTRIVRLLVTAAAGVAMAGVPTAPAYACSCAEDNLADQAASADAVFRGTVVDRDEPGWWKRVGSSGDPVVYELEVDEVFKGEVGPVAAVRSASSGASCGIEVSVGDDAVIFASYQGDELSASLCGGTTVSSHDPALVDLLGGPTDPDPDIEAAAERSAMVPPLVVGGAVLALAAGLVLAVLRR